MEGVLTDLLSQALASYVAPDEIWVSVDSIEPQSMTCIQSLRVRTIALASCNEARTNAKEILASHGIAPQVIEEAFQLLQSGPTPEGANMRGAIIMDVFTGKRIEPDIRRGVRVSRIDYTEQARRHLEKELKEFGIYHKRVMDALAIATKVAHRTETIAELCWSDNPDYTTGYIASGKDGYIRITHMKEKGSARGGRVFFVNPEGLNLERYIQCLEKQPVIIDRIGDVHAP
jgi:6-carboxyhexanoate--CoA ligase